MSLRLKFSLSFSLLVAIVLVSSVFVIYILYARTRIDDFRKRVWADAYHTYITYHNIKVKDNSIRQELNSYYPSSLPDHTVTILDINNRVLYREPDTLHKSISYSLLSKIISSKEYYFRDGKKECIGLYFNNPGEPAGFVISCSYDRFGEKRIDNLQWILGMVAAGGIIIIAVFSFIYVKQITEPLIELGEQIKQISENNLQERVKFTKSEIHYSEHARIAFQFNEMLDRLEKAFELQKSFVHHASHELRTPLATMFAQTEAALRKELTQAEAKEVLQSLKEDQHEMIELTNSLLLLSQYERVNYSNEWPLVRLDEILYETFGTVKRMFPDINVSLEFSQMPEDELFLSIRGNDSLLRSAFINLIKNAYNYSENKSVALTIDSEGNLIHIHFENNGKLLSEAEQERLFIPFFRGGNAQLKKGFGLGLSIVQRIVSLHKGMISYSVHNGLNRFTITFNKSME